MPGLEQYHHDGLTFDVADAGTGDEVIVLLHGFPESKESWTDVTPHLVEAGYRVLAPDQRGYSPDARPHGRRAYAMRNLVGDVLALADAAGADRFHLVGHDWGGGVAWATAASHPERLATMTSLATPHARAMARSMVSSRQALHSWYILAFQVPWLPERSIATARGGARFASSLVRSGLSEQRAAGYVQLLRSGAAGPAINWYRALPFGARDASAPVTVPTLYVYGDGDFALGRKAADLTGRYVSGPYRYEALEGVSHWIPEEVPDEVARLVLEHVSSHSASAGQSTMAE